MIPVLKNHFQKSLRKPIVQIILFGIFIWILHLIFNHNPIYQITGFNQASYRYIYLSAFAFMFYGGLFYFVRTNYKKADKAFYLTFAIWLVILLTALVIFFPGFHHGDLPSYVTGVRNLWRSVS